MFKKLKKQSIITLSLTIIALILFQIIVNYISYKKILYDDYTSKATIFSELHSENIDTYFKQFDQNLSIFLNNYDPAVFDGSTPLKDSEYLEDVLTNMVRYKFDMNIQDIIIFSNSGDYISYNNLFIPDAVKKIGVLDTLKEKDVCLYYNPKMQIVHNPYASTDFAKYTFLYGKTFYDEAGKPLFYVIASLSTNLFSTVLNIDEYFTKDTSIYLVFGEHVYTISESKETKIENVLKPAKRNNGKCFRIDNYNETYDISIITNTLSNDSSFFINMIIPIMIVFAAIIGIICFLCAKGIVGQIINPLESINIKMKHFK